MRPAQTVLAQINPGEMVLVGARPQQGKTTFCLQMGMVAMQQQSHCYFFSLDAVLSEMQTRFSRLGDSILNHEQRFHFDDSDDISAQYLMQQLAAAPADSLVVVDFLQALEFRRDQPGLDVQLPMLKSFARQQRLEVVFISQIDRRCEQRLPGVADIKVSNPFDLDVFDRLCFLHEGQLHLQAA